ncbi:hypothetical protein BG653_06823 [Streptomyces platensis]|uniref:Uncharacterized protein n=1 Tax=Streptomyces platensis TaxID=58346 RepID=A0ABX3XN64_STRPT|nr:hypothetical protein BG653_06823 [Streptomyces platensis]
MASRHAQGAQQRFEGAGRRQPVLGLGGAAAEIQEELSVREVLRHLVGDAQRECCLAHPGRSVDEVAGRGVARTARQSGGQTGEVLGTPCERLRFGWQGHRVGPWTGRIGCGLLGEGAVVPVREVAAPALQPGALSRGERPRQPGE